VSRTYNTMPPWVQAARRAGVRLPADWREPLPDPAWDGRHPHAWRGLGRLARWRHLEDLVGSAPSHFGGGPLGGKWRGIGAAARQENRRLRHRDRQALRQGRYDTPPPRHRNSAHWDYW
jgi:hypothetical protein